MHPTIKRLVEQIDRTFPGNKQSLQRFADRPEFERIANDIEKEGLAERAQDAEQLRTVDERCDAAARPALKALTLAQDRLVKLERDRLEAIEDIGRTSAAAAALSFRRDRERADLEQKLRSSAHPLIAKTIDALQEFLMNRLRNSVALQFGEYASPQTGETRHGVTGSNHKECNVAIAATHAVMARCSAMQLSALPAVEVELQITKLLDGLRRPFAAVALQVPRIVGDDAIASRAEQPVGNTVEAQ